MLLPKKEEAANLEGSEIDWRQLLQPVGVDEKARLIRDLITNDKNLRTKARIIDPFNATVIDQMAHFPKSRDLNDLITRWGEAYRENGISEEGGSRVEYTTAVIGFHAEPDAERTETQMKEGNRK